MAANCATTARAQHNSIDTAVYQRTTLSLENRFRKLSTHPNSTPYTNPVESLKLFFLISVTKEMVRGRRFQSQIWIRTQNSQSTYYHGFLFLITRFYQSSKRRFRL